MELRALMSYDRHFKWILSGFSGFHILGGSLSSKIVQGGDSITLKSLRGFIVIYSRYYKSTGIRAGVK